MFHFSRSGAYLSLTFALIFFFSILPFVLSSTFDVNRRCGKMILQRNETLKKPDKDDCRLNCMSKAEYENTQDRSREGGGGSGGGDEEERRNTLSGIY